MRTALNKLENVIFEKQIQTIFYWINKHKILNYCEIIKNNEYCIIDFELQNFIFNIHTNEIFLI
jgi:hypothetical protein